MRRRRRPMESEPKCWCQNCKKELSLSHTGPCPYCGNVGKDCDVTCRATAKGMVSLNRIHKPKWSSKSLALISGICATLLAVSIPGILTFLPYKASTNYCILIIILVVVGSMLWWKRYSVLMLVRKLEDKLGSEKRL